MRKEWEEAHTVTEELVEGPPSRRANATLTPCPNGNHLWCIGGEFFSEDGRAVRVMCHNVVLTSLYARPVLLQRCVQIYTGERRMAQICFSNMSGTEVSTCRSLITCRRREIILVRYVKPGALSQYQSKITPGGEFSSLHQTTFHHYRDFWCFDIGTHSWDRIDTKIRPSARSGHRYVHLTLTALLLIVVANRDLTS